jgi:hypothetical protein
MKEDAMDLYCKTVPLWGQQVNVGGKIIDIPLGGIVSGLDDATANRLLGDPSGWELRAPAPTSAAKPAPAAKPATAAPATPAAAPAAPAKPEALEDLKKASESTTRTRRRGEKE